MARKNIQELRRVELIAATIDEIGQAGNLGITVNQIARRAGVSTALAFHYFGEKEQIFLAAMRHILTLYGDEIQEALARQRAPDQRLMAIIDISFSPSSFRKSVIAAWMNFYVLALTSTEAKRLLRVYQKRLRSNLLHALRPLIGDKATDVATEISGLIDGLYLNAALSPGQVTATQAHHIVLQAANRALSAYSLSSEPASEGRRPSNTPHGASHPNTQYSG